MKLVTNKELAVKLDNLLEAVREHREEFREHIKSDEETREMVLRLNIIEHGREWHLKTLWAAVVTMIGGIIVKWSIWHQ